MGYNNNSSFQNSVDEDDFLSDTQIVVDIGHLKDIDQSPKNIKELSKFMAEQFATLLNSEIKRMNNESSNNHGKPYRSLP